MRRAVNNIELIAMAVSDLNVTEDRRFYVYTLADSRDGEVFYVGKGCGQRMYQHEKDCRAGRVVNGDKHAKISAIIRAGAAVVAQKVHDGLTESEALDAERALIRSIGIRRLTNVMPGQESIDSQMIELTKIRYSQCTKTIALAADGHPVCDDWLAAEIGWKAACERILTSRGVAPVPWDASSHAA